MMKKIKYRQTGLIDSLKKAITEEYMSAESKYLQLCKQDI